MWHLICNLSSVLEIDPGSVWDVDTHTNILLHGLCWLRSRLLDIRGEFFSGIIAWCCHESPILHVIFVALVASDGLCFVDYFTTGDWHFGRVVFGSITSDHPLSFPVSAWKKETTIARSNWRLRDMSHMFGTSHDRHQFAGQRVRRGFRAWYSWPMQVLTILICVWRCVRTDNAHPCGSNYGVSFWWWSAFALSCLNIACGGHPINSSYACAGRLCYPRKGFELNTLNPLPPHS